MLRKDLFRKVKPNKEKEVVPSEQTPPAEPDLKPSAAAVESSSTALPIVFTGTSRGLHLLPGTAVSGLAQRPSSEKPQRPIVYTTRVLMQQKIREYMNTPGVENMAFPIPATAHYTQQSRLFGSETATSTSASLMHQRGWPPGVSFDDSLVVNGSSSSSAWESLVSEKVSDFRYTLAGTTNLAGNHPASPPRSNNAALEYSAAAREMSMKPNSGYLSTERVPPSSDEEGDGLGSLNLELSVAEWSLILEAARAEAHEMNLDIMQGSDLYEETTIQQGTGNPNEPVEQVEAEVDGGEYSNAPPRREIASGGRSAESRSGLGTADLSHPVTVAELLHDPRDSPLQHYQQHAVPAYENPAAPSIPALVGLLSEEEDWRPAKMYGGSSSPPRQRPDPEGFQQLAALLAQSYGIPDARASQHRSSPPRVPPVPMTTLTGASAATGAMPVQAVQQHVAKQPAKQHAHGLAFSNAARYASPERDRELPSSLDRADRGELPGPWVLSAVAPAFTAHPASSRKVKIAETATVYTLGNTTASQLNAELGMHVVRPITVELPRTPLKLTDDDSDHEESTVH
jgi:hypothetical protein